MFLYDKGLMEGGIYWAVSAFAFSFVVSAFTRNDGLITIAGLASILVGTFMAVQALGIF